jgi:hypothetical protein
MFCQITAAESRTAIRGRSGSIAKMCALAGDTSCLPCQACNRRRLRCLRNFLTPNNASVDAAQFIFAFNLDAAQKNVVADNLLFQRVSRPVTEGRCAIF